ncbi:cupin-like domain-containing protein [Sphingomonas deserti]|uniref:Cupin-like domain-containing protein n=1 Tax=Allosphingosinicella deserti TaxID=2116704 RepID=A0A2P7QKV1_9SPHN|nr:cupin-like domain-containing protein [Sphingomonas deserti]
MDGVDRRRFEDDIRAAHQPVIFRGLAAQWPAVQAARQSDEALIAYLRQFRRDGPVAVLLGEPGINGRFFYNHDLTGFNFTRGRSPLDPFFDRLLRDRNDPAPYSVAVQSEPVPQVFPGFETENGLDLLDAAIVPRAWMGNRIMVAPHYDLMENIGCVVAGRRRFTLFPPDQIGNLYPGPMELTPAGTPVSMVDLANPDLERYPRFAAAMETAQVADLEPGDAIYIPFHWWHGVESLEPLNLFVNYWWNDARKDIGRPYDALMYGFFALRNLPAEQRAVWRTVFDYYVFQTDSDPAAHLPPQAQGILGPLTPDMLRRIRATLKEISSNL